jgi:signal peptidase I
MSLLDRRRILVVGISLLVVAAVPSYIRAYVIAGDSDAPAFVSGDRILVNLAAYDIRAPYSSYRLARLADPTPGDVVLISLANGQLAVKRIIAGPGTRIAMQDNHVTIDGVALEYVAVTPQETAVISRGRLGPVIEVEHGIGSEVHISFARDDGLGSFEEQVVPEGHYFVLGANRDVSIDSRHFGPLPRERILGKMIGRIGSANRPPETAR